MARKTKYVTITEEGRDRGKAFLLTEAPASQAEWFGMRLLLLAAKSGANVANVNAGLAGVAVIIYQSAMYGIAAADLKPLLDEMFECVQLAPDPRNPQLVRALLDDDIEEIATRLKLRQEVVELHLGFSLAERLSTLGSLQEAPAGSSATPTSPTPSAP